MAKRKLQYGKCKLCQKDTMLSFEHVPPRSAFNKTTRYISIAPLDYIKTKDPILNPPNGKIKQGGTGFYAFCESCNNFLGRTYVQSYEKWVKIGADVLNQSKWSNNFQSFVAFNIEPIKILKHIVSMFIAVNDNSYFKKYPELIDFVRNPNSSDLPEKFKIFSYLNNEGQFRLISHCFVFKTLIEQITCSEIAFPPYGYVLTFESNDVLDQLTNITGFKNHEPNIEYDVSICLYKHPTYIPISALDYRTKQEIQKNL